MLRAIRTSPVSDLVTEGDSTTALAEDTLDDVCRDVQSLGWAFNRRTVTLSIDGSGNATVPDTYVTVEAPGYPNRYGVRGKLLYDLNENTDVFSNDIEVEIIELLDWDDLPEQAKNFIVKQASRQLADALVTDPQLSRVLRQDEAQAYQTLRRHHVVIGNQRIWGPDGSAIVDRGSPLNLYPY